MTKQTAQHAPSNSKQRDMWKKVVLLSVTALFLASAQYAWADAGQTSPQAADDKAAPSKKVAQADSASAAGVKKKAAPPASDSGWHLRAELATNVPLDISGRLTLEMPGRLRLSTSLGGVPSGFVDTINGAMQGAGVYNQQVADIIKLSFQEAIIWRLQVEWRPFAKAGFYFGGGYGLLSLKGQLGGAQYAGTAASLGIPSSYVTAVGYEIQSTIHMLNAEIGWEWNFLRFLSLRVAAGFTGTIASTTNVVTQVNANVPAQARTAAQSVGTAAAASLDGIYRNYVFSPTLSMALGFRFF